MLGIFAPLSCVWLTMDILLLGLTFTVFLLEARSELLLLEAIRPQGGPQIPSFSDVFRVILEATSFTLKGCLVWGVQCF